MFRTENVYKTDRCSYYGCVGVGVGTVTGKVPYVERDGSCILWKSWRTYCRTGHARQFLIQGIVVPSSHSYRWRGPHPVLLYSLFLHELLIILSLNMAINDSIDLDHDVQSIRSNCSSLCLGEDDRRYLEALKDRDYVVTKNTRQPLGLFSVVAFILQQVIGEYPYSCICEFY
jgi:hypothetical protein